MSAIRTHPEIAPWRAYCVAEDAVRRETVSRAGSPCNLRFAGRFSEIAGRADPIAANFSNGFKVLEGVLPTQGAGSIFGIAGKGAGRIFGIAGKSSVGIVPC